MGCDGVRTLSAPQYSAAQTVARTKVPSSNKKVEFLWPVAIEGL